MTNYLENKTYLVYDRSKIKPQSDPLSHFALDDALIRQANTEGTQLLLHFWPTEEMVILGMMDSKLPYLGKGIQYLQNQQYKVVMRNSGGLAVMANQGILNFSLILPEVSEEKLTIHEGYEIMLDLIQGTFASFNKEVKAFEISDSYCPGEFDLSIDGKKFAGIAQRRFKKGISIMIYLSVEGNQSLRGETIRSFYEHSLQGEKTRWHFPEVNPSSMANLSDLLETPLTVQDVQNRITDTLKNNNNQLVEGAYSPELLAEYQVAYDKMKKRNQQIFENIQEV
ncbi:lipoate--protein ligase family protein [Jeotgalibaca sp. MA1X17-3]|uniref:lipoate--protein ligase family protein n=1 Tax=Jeotgalibaca sp. MA1X17-3 TaxID=2908211 RepID=UPI001F4145FA|nr:lipoate--protein ligase family protein [Jeotgalibaca sp. MA1X17-3]UJF15915.1 lipoate--protein ligase family protein [Jeotgalibaca sp. MA1X17-3]